MDDRLGGIATFVQAVEGGSFALAAERMQLTRSAVGKRIAALERRLGVVLFHRTTRRQSLTENGQLFYERCKRALQELDSAEAAFDAGRREPIGRLRVTASTLFGRYCVAPILSALVRRHPQLELEMSLTDRVVDLQDEGFDLAVRIGDLPNSSTLAARRLGAQHFVMCAAPAYLAEHGTPTCIEDFAGHFGIAYRHAIAETPWQLRDEHGVNRTLPIVPRLRFDDVQAIADAAIAGYGLARLPRWQINRQLECGELVLVMDQAPMFSTDIHAVWPQTRYLASKTRVAIDALVDGIPRLLGGPHAPSR